MVLVQSQRGPFQRLQVRASFTIFIVILIGLTLLFVFVRRAKRERISQVIGSSPFLAREVVLKCVALEHKFGGFHGL